MVAMSNAAVVFALVAAGGLATEAGAQVRGPAQLPRVGARVRVIAPTIREDRYVGTVESLPRDSITLDTAGVRRRLGFDTGPVLVEEFRRVTIPTSAIQAIDISTGRTHRRSTIKGIIYGSIGGGLLFGATNLPEVNPSFSDFVDGAVVGVLVGAVAG